MSVWFEAEGLLGMAAWMRAQSAEELTRAHRFLDFVLDRDGRVELEPIPAPVIDLETPLDVFRRSLAQEQAVTASINDIYALGVAAKDFASDPILDWFVAQQVEEESSVQQIIDDLVRAADAGHTILIIDRALGARGGGAEASPSAGE